MKKLIAVLILSLSSAVAFAEEQSRDEILIKLSFGETKVIYKPTTVACPPSPADKTCVLRQKYRGSYYYDKDTALVATGFTSVAGPHGLIPTEQTVELGVFATRKEAEARMKELQKTGYCL